MRGVQGQPGAARALDKIFILHADHEQNASTNTVRSSGSSGANPFACIAAGIACLWGPAHGGANEAALKMLTEIGEVKNIPAFIKRAKDKEDLFRVMGFGHRVYKNYDPRAKIMQKLCHEVLKETGKADDPVLQVALEFERILLSDDYFISRKLYPNVDFYSGITLKALGFPTSMFTVLFAVARTVGWIAQWKEMIERPELQDRPPAPAVQRPGRAQVRSARQALSKPARQPKRKAGRVRTGLFHLAACSLLAHRRDHLVGRALARRALAGRHDRGRAARTPRAVAAGRGHPA